MLQGLRGEGTGIFGNGVTLTDSEGREDQVDPTQECFVSCGNCKGVHASSAVVRACYAKNTAPVQTGRNRPNKYGGSCSNCGGYVGAGEGLLGGKVNGAWTVTHAVDGCPTETAPVVEEKPYVHRPVNDEIAFPDDFYVDGHFNQRYTIVFDDGERRTLQVRKAENGKGDFWDGRVVIDLLTGSDNTSDYTNIAHVKDDGRVHFNRAYRSTILAEAVKVMVGDPKAAATAYGLESSQCFRCHAELTVPESIERGFGPECAKKAGFA